MAKIKTFAAAALIAAQAPAASANTIGAVSAANRDVSGTPPAATTRQLVIGDDLVTNERVESSAIGSGQFLFLDQSSLTVAPNSNIVLDKYIYDPSTQTGEFAISMSRGVLRFVGGRISKTRDAVVTTPTATIGIRGGMSIIIVAPDGATRVMHIAGEYTRLTTLNGEEITISRSNGAAEAPLGGGINYFGIATQDLIKETTLALIGRGEAGEKVKPEDLDVIASNMPGANSEAKNAATDPPTSTSGERDFVAFDEDRDTKRTDEEVTSPHQQDEGKTVSDNSGGGETGGGGSGGKSGGGGSSGGGSAGGGTGGTNPDPSPGPTLLAGVTGGASLGGVSYGFVEVYEGSRIGVTADGEKFVIPTQPGFFNFSPDDGATAIDPIFGAGFFDPEAEFTYAVFETTGGVPGSFIAGKRSGAPVLAPAGAILRRNYQISEDLKTGAEPFTPLTLGGFTSGGMSDLALLSNTGGAAAGGNAKAVITYLQIDNDAQRAGLGVFTANVEASSGGAPRFDGAFEGSFSTTDGQAIIHTPIATLDDGSGGTAFGPDGQYFALTNNTVLGLEEETPGFAYPLGAPIVNYTTHSVASHQSTDTITTETRALLPSNTLTGHAAATGVEVGGQAYYARSEGNSGVLMTLDPANNVMSGRIQLDNFNTPILSGADFSFIEINNLIVHFGGPDGESALITDREYAARGASCR